MSLKSIEKIKKPIIFQKRSAFINCKDILVCAFLSSYVETHHWMFSQSWGFYYKDLKTISCYKNELHPFWENLFQLYQSKQFILRDKDLKEAISEAFEHGVPLFTLTDAYYVPWITYDYLQNSHPHYLLITDYNPSTNEVYVFDLAPEKEGWMPFDVIEKAYIERGYYSFYLTTPVQIELTKETLKSQLSGCIDRIVGNDTTDTLYSGLVGLHQFYQDLESADLQDKEYYKIWWDRLGEVGGLREGMLEFVHFLNQNEKSPYYQAINPELISAIDDAVNRWFAFRNILYKYKGKPVAKEKYLTFFQRVIDTEKKCLKILTSGLIER